MFEELANNQIYAWVILPILIFLARILDQSLGTIRVILTAKGYKFIAPVLGFFESLAWILAASQVIYQVDNVVCYIFYGGGFTAGSYIGMIIEEKLSIGTVVIRIIPKQNTDKLIKYLRAHDYGVTCIDVEGMDGKSKMLLTIVKRKKARDVINLVNLFNPKAFYTIEEVKSVNEGYFPSPDRRRWFSFGNALIRKSK
jgi:uncharacterized protein YebE (UPF0316 family)